jgi:ABC-type sugar transport system permease subunit
MRFLGVENNINLIQDPLFTKALVNTLFIEIIAYIPILGGGMVLVSSYSKSSTVSRVPPPPSVSSP